MAVHYGIHLEIRCFIRLLLPIIMFFRKLLGIKRDESISAIYATLNIDAFQVLNRKSLYSFMNRLSLSDKIIINCITSSLFHRSESVARLLWNNKLYT